MSALLFRKGKQGLIDGSIDMDAGNIKIVQLQLDGTLTDTHVKAITGITNASPMVVTITAHGWTNGDIIWIRGVLGITAANGLWQIGGVTTNTFTLLTRKDAQNSTGNTAYTSGGVAVNLTAATNLSDVDGAQIGAFSGALGSPTTVNGVFDASDASLTLNGTIHGHAVFNDTGTASTSRLIALLDGKTQVICAADAATSATTVWVEPLEGIIPSGTVLVFSNGASATLSAQANAGARSLTVTALAAGITAGHHADAQTQNSGYPLSLGGGTYTLQFDNGNSRIFEV